jgi:hypothetical protein
MRMTIKGSLRAAILTGAVGFLPTVALADEPEASAADLGRVPDHAEAEEPGAGRSAVTETADIPDHAQAEARGTATTTIPRDEINVPDHAEAEEAPADDRR